MGVHVVPAFVGLGAPHWDPEARGAVLGLTRGVTRAHLIRATLESVAFQTRDVADAMAADAGGPLHELRVDGGAAANDFLMQFQADVLGVPVERPALVETTAVGAAQLAGLAVGFWRTPRELEAMRRKGRRFRPRMSAERREALYRGWHEAVRRVRSSLA
jgi:glycerol kinase